MEGGETLIQPDQNGAKSDPFPIETVSVLAITPTGAPSVGLHAYWHYCPALGIEVLIEIFRARLGFSEVQFCCYCGLRVDRRRPSSSGQDWDCGVVRDLAGRWLGNDATVVREWIDPEGHASMRLAQTRGPLLEFLLRKIRSIVQRRRDRLSRTLYAADREFDSVWRAEQLLDAFRAPLVCANVDRVGFVYAISNGMHLKIGWSIRHPDLSRLQNLQVASAHKLDVAGAFVGTQQDERAAHDRFSSYRVRGEWFHDVPKIRDYFKTRSQSDKNTDHSA